MSINKLVDWLKIAILVTATIAGYAGLSGVAIAGVTTYFLFTETEKLRLSRGK